MQRLIFINFLNRVLNKMDEIDEFAKLAFSVFENLNEIRSTTSERDECYWFQLNLERVLIIKFNQSLFTFPPCSPFSSS